VPPFPEEEAMRSTTAAFPLSDYRDQFPEVCRQKFGRSYNFARLEKRLEPLRTGQRWLVARDVLTIFDPEHTPLRRYWPIPPEKELDRALKQRLYLGPLKSQQDPQLLVEQLLVVFHNIGVVSIVLRFVHPQQFAIFSTPVAHLLMVHGATAVEAYLAFCEELRAWQQHFGLASVAETEMALWTYDQIVRHSDDAAQVERARGAFERDLWVQRRRAAQVLRPFLRSYGPLELARILLEEDANLAGKIAAEEYERLLSAAARKYFRQALASRKGAVLGLLDALAREGHITAAERVELQRIWEIRNKAVHAGTRPTPEEVEVMIDWIESICSHWE
jgi:hypothetical protein